MPARRRKPLASSCGAEIPVIEARVHLAVERLGGEQRRRAVDDRRLRFQVDAVLLHARLQQQPALVDRAAADAELAALQIGERLDRRGRGHHHRAERAGIGIEGELGAERALARHPEPVRHHDVGIAGAQRDLAGLGACKLGDLERQVGLLVEPGGADRRELPGEGSGLLHRKADGLRAAWRRRCASASIIASANVRPKTLITL